MCERVFGTGMDQVEGGIKSTNNAYGGRYKYSVSDPSRCFTHSFETYSVICLGCTH